MSQMSNDPKFSFCAWFLFKGTISRKTSQAEKVPKTLSQKSPKSYFEKWRVYQEVRGDGGEGLKGMAETEWQKHIRLYKRGKSL